MRKIIFAAAMSLLLASCTKKDNTNPTNNNNNTSIPTDGWKLGNTNYKTVYAARTTGNNMLSAMDGIPQGSNPAVNSLSVWFKALPTADGSYKVKAYASGGGREPQDGEIGVSAGVYSSGASYIASDSSTVVNATITVTNGKIKVVLPEIWMRNLKTPTDSVKLSGTIQES